MKALEIGTDAVELTTYPFIEGCTVVATKPTATNATLQGSTTVDGDYTTIATITALEYQEVSLTYPFVKLASGSSIFLLGT